MLNFMVVVFICVRSVQYNYYDIVVAQYLLYYRCQIHVWRFRTGRMISFSSANYLSVF